MTRCWRATAAAVAAIVQVSAHGATSTPGSTRLSTVREWNHFCHDPDSAEATMRCRIRIQRAVGKGRAVAAFDAVTVSNPDLLQSRSGVLFDAMLNQRVVRIVEDSGYRTTVRLERGVECQAYSAAPDLVGVPSRQRNYAGLVRTWLDVVSDGPSEIRSISHARQGGKAALRFEAAGHASQLIRGAYLFDAEANAAIFSTCLLPHASNDGQQVAERFFDAIFGSSRRFI